MAYFEKGDRLSYGLLDDALWHNAKARSFTSDEFRLWVVSIAWCRNHKSTKGFLTGEDIAVISALHKLPRGVIRGLISKRGLDVAEGGYLVHGYYEMYEEKAAGGRARASGAIRSEGKFLKVEPALEPAVTPAAAPAAHQRAHQQMTPAEHQLPSPIPTIGTNALVMSLSTEIDYPHSASPRAPYRKPTVRSGNHLAVEIMRLWQKHKGWQKWPPTERFDAITITRWTKEKQYPIEFWEEFIPTIPTTAKFAYVTTSAESGTVCRAEQEYIKWRERWWAEAKADDKDSSTIFLSEALRRRANGAVATS